MKEVNFKKLKKEFLDIVETKIKKRKEAVDTMLGAMSEGFYTAPASTRFHCCFRYGLLYHSLNVYNNIVKLNEMFEFGYKAETLAIVGLFHDLGKIGNEFGPYYIQEDQWHADHGMPYKMNYDIKYMQHEQQSVYLLNKYKVKLSFEEHQAIVSSNNSSISDSESILCAILKSADLLAVKIEARDFPKQN